MNIRLGNLKNNSLYDGKDLEKFEEFLKINNIKRVDNCELAESKKGSYHIYDMPRIIFVSDKETFEILKDYFLKEGNTPNGNWGMAYNNN